MSFLTKEKTNWKYISISVILALIVGGGILGYLRYFNKEISSLTKFPEIKKPEKVVGEETANWKTYRNEAYGYEIKYPQDWPLPEIETDWDVTKADEVSWGQGIQKKMYISVWDKGGHSSEEWAEGKIEPYEIFAGTDPKYAEYRKKEILIEGVKIVILESKWGNKFLFIPRGDYIYHLAIIHEANADLILSTFQFIEIKEELQRFRYFPRISSRINFSACDKGSVPEELENKIKKMAQDISGDIPFPGWGEYTICVIDLDDNEATQEFAVDFTLPSANHPQSMFQKLNGSWKEILAESSIGFDIEEEKINGYHNIISYAHLSARETLVRRYKWNSISLQYEEDKEWAEKFGREWSDLELQKVFNK
jgi:hypothetical protein